MNTISTLKDGNPKDAVGVKKVPFSTIPAPILAEVGLAMLEGALKYGRHNYRAVGVRASVYYDAVFRHLSAWWEGEDIDPDSGLSHLTKAIACLVVLRDSQRLGNSTDDRPPSHMDGWQQELNKKAAELIEKYPNPKEAHLRNRRLSLFDSIKHGSDDHKAWLKEAIDNYQHGKPVPEPRS